VGCLDAMVQALCLRNPYSTNSKSRASSTAICPPDPQLKFSHGQVLSLLLAARLCQPTVLANIPAWARKIGADILWNLPADKLDIFGNSNK
jgi:hypothetical protein